MRWPKWAYSPDPKIGLTPAGLFAGVACCVVALIPALMLLGEVTR